MNKHQITANSKTMCRSCIMVAEQKYLDQFKPLGLKEVFTNKDGVIIYDIPLNNVNKFVDLYLDVMKPGGWNEYVGPQTGFYFKMPDGEKRHILLTEESEPEIVSSLKVFIPNWNENISLWDWLASVDIYRDWLK